MSPQKAKVIIVEDDEDALQAAERALEKAKHSLLFSAKDLQTAEQKLAELTILPDVALIDGSFPARPEYYMPDKYLSAYFASQVREKFPETSIVVFSHDKKRKFSPLRFPPEGSKSDLIVERDLGQFVTSLPPATRK